MSDTREIVGTGLNVFMIILQLMAAWAREKNLTLEQVMTMFNETYPKFMDASSVPVDPVKLD